MCTHPACIYMMTRSKVATVWTNLVACAHVPKEKVRNVIRQTGSSELSYRGVYRIQVTDTITGPVSMDDSNGMASLVQLSLILNPWENRYAHLTYILNIP